MDLSLEFLQTALAPHASTTIANTRSGQRFRGVRILHPGAMPQKNVLYLRGENLAELDYVQAEALKNAGLVTVGNVADPLDGIPVMHFDDIDSAEAFNLVNSTFDFFEEWTEQVYERALSMPDLDSLMALLNEVTPNPWYIADGSYRVLTARSAPDVEDLSYIWRFLYRNRRLPLETILAMEDMGKIEQMSRRKKAYIPSVTPFNIPFVSKSVTIPGGAVAHFYIIGVYTRLSQYEIEIADFFGNVLSQVLARDRKLLPGAVRFYDSFLSDLATGVVAADSDDIMQRMYADFGWEPSDQLQLAVFENGGKAGSASDAQKISALESHCDARGFYLEGRMAAVINITRSKKGSNVDDDTCARLVRPLAREMKCAVGLSERFAGFGGMLRMKTWHEQALFAASIPNPVPEGAGQSMGNAPTIRTFSSVAMLYFRERVVRPSALDAFQHPGLTALRDYDEKHNASLYETLCVYLENDRNTSMASDKLFIHRNTLLKRLRKIQTLASVDLDDAECRKRLLASIVAR